MPVSEIDIVGATGSSHSSHSPSPLEPLFHFPSTYDPSPSFLLFLAISLGRLTFHGLLTLYSEFSAGIFQTARNQPCAHDARYRISRILPSLSTVQFFQKIFLSTSNLLIHLFQTLGVNLIIGNNLISSISFTLFLRHRGIKKSSTNT